MPSGKQIRGLQSKSDYNEQDTLLSVTEDTIKLMNKEKNSNREFKQNKGTILYKISLCLLSVLTFLILNGNSSTKFLNIKM